MSETNKLFFFKGQEDILTKTKETDNNDNSIEKIRDAFNKVLDGKNLSFLLGCGCSSFMIENEEGKTKKRIDIGIPTVYECIIVLIICINHFNTSNI